MKYVEYHEHEIIDDGWVCVNDKSEFFRIGQNTMTPAKNGRKNDKSGSVNSNSK